MRPSVKKETNVPTRFGEFLCLFELNAPEPGFTVTAPGAPGFVTGGRTLAQAQRLARAGLEFHCECLFLEQAKQRARRTPAVLAPAL